MEGMLAIVGTVALVVVVSTVCVVLWLRVYTGIRRRAGFSTDARYAELRRQAVNASGWGSVRVGWLGLNNCIRVYRIERGFLFRLMPVFGGGGYRELRDDDISGVRTLTGSVLVPPSIEITTRSGDTLRVYGRVAGMMRSYLG